METNESIKKDNNINESTNENENLNKSSKNIFTKFWKYFTTYEKIWLLIMFTGGIVITVLFPEEHGWLIGFEIVTLLGGCSCELLLSKQSKWAFIVSFFFYDLTQIVIYIADGYYISAVFEVLFWVPMLFISFFSWDKKQDAENKAKTQVKEINYKQEIVMFISVLVISLLTGLIFTFVGGWFEGLSDIWYVDALANTFSVCNGLFLWFRYKEQWIAWLGVIVCETIMWSVSSNWIMLLLQVGYLTNTIYGFILWTKYIKKNKNKHNKMEEITENKDLTSSMENKNK